jgi:hypothetical protein
MRSHVLKCFAVLVLFTSMKVAAQNAVSDWDAISLNTIVVTAKKGPPVAPVYFATQRSRCTTPRTPLTIALLRLPYR